MTSGPEMLGLLPPPQDPEALEREIRSRVKMLEQLAIERNLRFAQSIGGAAKMQEYQQAQAMDRGLAEQGRDMDLIRLQAMTTDTRVPGGAEAIQGALAQLQEKYGSAVAPEALDLQRMLQGAQQAQQGLAEDVPFLRSRMQQMLGGYTSTGEVVRGVGESLLTGLTAGLIPGTGTRAERFRDATQELVNQIMRERFPAEEGDRESAVVRIGEEWAPTTGRSLKTRGVGDRKLYRQLLEDESRRLVEETIKSVPDLSPGGVEEFVSKAAEIGGSLLPFGKGVQAGEVVGKATAGIVKKMVGKGGGKKLLEAGAAKTFLGRVLQKQGGSMVTLGTLGFLAPIRRDQRQRIDEEVPEERREDAEMAARIENGIYLGALAPVFEIAGIAGRVGGAVGSKVAGKFGGAVGSGAGMATAFPVLGQLGQEAIDAYKQMSLEERNEVGKLIQQHVIARPQVGSALREFAAAVAAGDWTKAWEGAKHYGKEVAPGFAAFTAVNLMGLAINSRRGAMAKRGGPEILEKAKDEAAKELQAATDDPKVVEELRASLMRRVDDVVAKYEGEKGEAQKLSDEIAKRGQIPAEAADVVAQAKIEEGIAKERARQEPEYYNLRQPKEGEDLVEMSEAARRMGVDPTEIPEMAKRGEVELFFKHSRWEVPEQQVAGFETMAKPRAEVAERKGREGQARAVQLEVGKERTRALEQFFRYRRIAAEAKTPEARQQAQVRAEQWLEHARDLQAYQRARVAGIQIESLRGLPEPDRPKPPGAEPVEPARAQQMLAKAEIEAAGLEERVAKREREAITSGEAERLTRSRELSQQMRRTAQAWDKAFGGGGPRDVRRQMEGVAGYAEVEAEGARFLKGTLQPGEQLQVGGKTLTVLSHERPGEIKVAGEGGRPTTVMLRDLARMAGPTGEVTILPPVGKEELAALQAGPARQPRPEPPTEPTKPPQTPEGSVEIQSQQKEEVDTKVDTAKMEAEDLREAIKDVPEALQAGLETAKARASEAEQAFEAQEAARAAEAQQVRSEAIQDPPAGKTDVDTKVDMANQETSARTGVSPEVAPLTRALESSGVKPKSLVDSGGRIIPPEEVVQVEAIQRDPDRFQFRMETGEKGTEIGRAKPRQFVPERMSGPVILWRDRDGVVWIVDGHHRLDMAQKSGAKEIQARIYNEVDGWSAPEIRARAALVNIAQGNAKPIDVAKFMRDSGKTEEDLAAEGIAVGAASVRDAVSLASLEPGIWHKVVTGQMEQSRAIVVGGELGKYPDMQFAVLNLADKDTRVGNMNAEEFRQFVRGFREDAIRSAGTRKAQKGLFGEQAEFGATVEKSALVAKLLKDYRSNAKLFAGVAKEGNKKKLEAYGNKLKDQENEEVARRFAEMADLLDREAWLVGDVSQILSEAVGGKKSEAKAYVTDRLLDYLKKGGKPAEPAGPQNPLYAKRGDVTASLFPAGGQEIKANPKALDPAEPTAAFPRVTEDTALSAKAYADAYDLVLRWAKGDAAAAQEFAKHGLTGPLGPSEVYAVLLRKSGKTMLHGYEEEARKLRSTWEAMDPAAWLQAHLPVLRSEVGVVARAVDPTMQAFLAKVNAELLRRGIATDSMGASTLPGVALFNNVIRSGFRDAHSELMKSLEREPAKEPNWFRKIKIAGIDFGRALEFGTSWGGWVFRTFAQALQTARGDVLNFRRIFHWKKGEFAGIREGDAVDQMIYRAIEMEKDSPDYKAFIQAARANPQGDERLAFRKMVRIMRWHDKVRDQAIEHNPRTQAYRREIEAAAAERQEFLAKAKAVGDQIQRAEALIAMDGTAQVLRQQMRDTSKQLKRTKNKAMKATLRQQRGLLAEHYTRRVRELGSMTPEYLSKLRRMEIAEAARARAKMSRYEGYIADMQQNWGLKNYIHHLHEIDPSTHDFTKRLPDTVGYGEVGTKVRTKKSAGPLLKRKGAEGAVQSAIKAIWAYGHTMIPWIHQSKALGETHKLLWGELRLVPGKDLYKRGKVYYAGGEYENLGLYRTKVGREGMWTRKTLVRGIDADTPEGQRRKARLEELRIRREGAIVGSVKPTPSRAPEHEVVVLWRGKDPIGDQQLKNPNWVRANEKSGNLVLISKGDASRRLRSFQDGWMDQASALRRQDMTDLVNRATGAFREEQTGVIRVGERIARMATSWVSAMALGGPANLHNMLNAVLGAMGMNGMFFGGWRMHRTIGPMTRYWKRYMEMKASPATLEAHGNNLAAGVTKHIRTPEAELAKLSGPERMARQIEDDAFEDFLRSGITAGNRADQARQWLSWSNQDVRHHVVRQGKIHTGTIFDTLNATWFATWNAGEFAMRFQPYYLEYQAARARGATREQAAAAGFSAVHLGQMVYNRLTRSRFFDTGAGAMLGHLSQWSAHTFGRITQLPWKQQMAYYSYALGLMAGGLALGFDWFDQLGGRMGNVPFLGPKVESAALGLGIAKEGDPLGQTYGGWLYEDARLRSLPIPIPFPAITSPISRTLISLGRAGAEMVQGNGYEAADHFRQAVGMIDPRNSSQMRVLRKAFLTEPQPDGTYLYRSPTTGKASAFLRNQGALEFLFQSMPGQQSYLAMQFADSELARRRNEYIRGKQREVGERGVEWMKARQRASASGLEADAQAAREMQEDLQWRTRALGGKLDREDVVRWRRQALIETEFDYPMQNVLRAPSKMERVREFARLLRDPYYEMTEQNMRKLMRVLGGSQGFSTWISDVQGEPRREFIEAFRARRDALELTGGR